MDVSLETPDATDARLRRVIAGATLDAFDGEFLFEEFAADELRARLRPDALALVRDDGAWGQLVPAGPGREGERFFVFRFHFEAGLDNSGFVGWLATRLKQRLGTGVLVICGYNSGRGGVFDYWGCPASVGRAVLAEVEVLRAAGHEARGVPGNAFSPPAPLDGAGRHQAVGREPGDSVR